jgi:hypothetical protein
MGSKTVTTFYCDACEIELPQGEHDVRGAKVKTGAVAGMYTLQFGIAVDGDVGPIYRNSYSMLCVQCRTDLIRLIEGFHEGKKALRNGRQD